MIGHEYENQNISSCIPFIFIMIDVMNVVNWVVTFLTKIQFAIKLFNRLVE